MRELQHGFGIAEIGGFFPPVSGFERLALLSGEPFFKNPADPKHRGCVVLLSSGLEFLERLGFFARLEIAEALFGTGKRRLRGKERSCADARPKKTELSHHSSHSSFLPKNVGSGSPA